MISPQIIVLLASIAVLLVGAMIFWSNPRRLVNRAVSTCSVHIAAWLACLYLARAFPGGSTEGLFWFLMSCAVGGSVPMHFWLVKESIVGGFAASRRWWVKGAAWLVVSGALTVICFTDYFVPSHSTDAHRVFGWGYTGYVVVLLSLYAFLLVDATRTIRRVVGVGRVELQVWLLGGCSIAVAVIGLMIISAVTHNGRYIALQPLVILVFFTGTALAITTHRIFDARQILLVGGQKLVLIVTVAGIAYGLNLLLQMFLPDAVAFCVTIAVALWVAAAFNAWLDRVLHFYPRATTARQAAIAATQRERRIDGLETAFRSVLIGWGQTDRVIIVSGAQGELTLGQVTLRSEDVLLSSLRQLRWVTPERLHRERSTPGRAALAAFLKEHELGVLVLSEGPALTALFGLGSPASRRPYTYPQVLQLLELASIMEGAFERAHLSAKVQHAEQLATVGLLGASLAHEIRNPLVTIKTFVQLLPTQHANPAFRDKFFRLIAEEVHRIDQLTQQLLDLASPRVYSAAVIELHPVLRTSLELVTPKANHKGVDLVCAFEADPDHVFTDGAAAKQVVLNLCFNALQALEDRPEGQKRIELRTRNLADRLELSVSDTGPGIAPEILPRLFQPFQTTKSSGFGLGLAICSDVLANLNASISVDPPIPGQGATFRVIFPCQPS